MRSCTVRQEIFGTRDPSQLAWPFGHESHYYDTLKNKSVRLIAPVVVGPCYFLEAVQTLAWLGTNKRP